jgi:hypothetical protein
MSEVSIDVNEITGPMYLKRDELLTEAEREDVLAATARTEAKAKAERALSMGEIAAEGHEATAVTKRAYAERWNHIIAREESEAGITADPAVTRTDGEVTE